MNNLYSYYDYEEALYHMQYYKCIEIGKKLLPTLKDKTSKRLYKKLLKVTYRWDLPKEEMNNLMKLLWDIKVWLMVWSNWL